MLQTSYSTDAGQAWLRMWCSAMRASGGTSVLEKHLAQEPKRLPKVDMSAYSTPKHRGLAKQIGVLADKFLGCLIGSEYEESKEADIQKYADHTQGARHLGDVDYYMIHDVADRLDPGSGFLVLPDAREHAEVFWPLDFAIATHKPEGDARAHAPGECFFLSRFATVSAKEIRGLVEIVPVRTALIASAYIYPDKRPYYSESTIVGLVGKAWKSIEKRIISQRGANLNNDSIITVRDRSKEQDTELDWIARMSSSARLTMRYSWHVAFGSIPGPRMVLPTNPAGCLNLFRLRDKAPGASRRTALRHWVENHYRDRGDDPGILDYVRTHLRGNTRFKWNGIDCELLVSEFDLEKNEFFRTQAAEWRAMRKHNRVKVRLKNYH